MTLRKNEHHMDAIDQQLLEIVLEVQQYSIEPTFRRLAGRVMVFSDSAPCGIIN
ncbi:hypothetical protein [Iningainema tapete]|uniref:Uncharacterized protein n=1 Tax=Iningainema tapete BLCC-T55 TaxID=2748662 RepID=A0A8J6XFQ9_9CYAN|nr:hypothetical protein [Iningainema tapete]MBD2775850.1 hypothetical protein [Iningainema tapete BLCC-T55]